MADSQTSCAVGRLVERQATQDRIVKAAQAAPSKQENRSESTR